MKTTVKLVGVGAVITALTLQTSASPAIAATGVPFTNSKVDRVYAAGSDTTFGLMNDLASAYMESDGCLLTAVVFPPVLQQNQCQSRIDPDPPTEPPIAGDNVFENYDHDVVTNYFPQGSNAGRLQLCNQKSVLDGTLPDRDPRYPLIDIARSSSPPTSGFVCRDAVPGPDTGGEAGIALTFVAFARDAITWTHWNTGGGGGGANVTNLTVAQLRDIFITCAITNWNQVPAGVAGPINVFTAIPGSGTRSQWETFLGGGDSSTCIPAAFKNGNLADGERIQREHQMQPVEVAVNDPAAANESLSIYFMSVGLWNTNPGLAANSLIGNVNGVVPTGPNIISGAFPFARNVYNVYRTPSPPPAGVQPVASAAVRRFTGMVGNVTTANVQSVGWICKGDDYHSKQLGNATSPGIEDPTATQAWAEIKKAAFDQNGFFQLTVSYPQPLPDPPVVHRCELPINVPNG